MSSGRWSPSSARSTWSPHRHPARRPDRRGGRALPGPARPVDFTVPAPSVVREGFLAPLPGAGLADRAAGERGRLAARARRPLPPAGHRPPPPDPDRSLSFRSGS
jgi:hypothetical protein